MKFNFGRYFKKKGESDDVVNSDKVSEVRRQVMSLFGSHIEELEKLDIKPETLKRIVRVHREIVLQFAIAIAYPQINFFAEEAFEASLKFMNRQISGVLKDQNTVDEFEKKAIQLSEDIVDTIVRVRHNMEIPEPSEFEFDGVKITSLPDIENNAKLPLVNSSDTDDSNESNDEGESDEEENIDKKALEEKKSPKTSNRGRKPKNKR